MGMLLCCWSLLGELFVRVLDMLISMICWFADARVKLLLSLLLLAVLCIISPSSHHTSFLSPKPLPFLFS